MSKKNPYEPVFGRDVPPANAARRADVRLSDRGELLNPVPMEPPLGYIKQPSLSEQIRDMVRSERLRQEAEGAGFESFTDADDFDVGDDYDPSSPYEEIFEPPLAAPATPPVGGPEPAAPSPQPSSPSPEPASPLPKGGLADAGGG